MSDFVEKPLKKKLNKGNPASRLDNLERKTGPQPSASVRALDELSPDMGDQIAGRFIAPSDETAEPTDPAFSGVFLAAEEQELPDGTQDAWLAKINAGEVEFSVGIEGIYQNRLTNGYKHIADDGTTFRKGELGMTTLEGRTAPSFGLGYTENNGGTEKLTNGSFETGDLMGWTTVSGSPVVSSGPEMDGKNGTYFVKINNGDLISQTVNISASSMLVASVISQTESGVGGYTQVYLKYYTGANGTGTQIRTDTVYSNNSLFSVLTNKSFFAPSNAASVVIFLYTINQASYFDNVSILDFGVAANNYLGFEPIEGKIVSIMLDDDEKQLGQHPVAAMNVPPVEYFTQRPSAALVAFGGSGVDVGSHEYAITFVDRFGETSLNINGAGLTTTVNVTSSANDQVNLSSIPLGKWGTTARKIYRTKVGADTTDYSNWFFVATINDNTTTTYSDTTPDASLGAETIPTVNTTGSRPAWPRTFMATGLQVVGPAGKTIVTTILTSAPTNCYNGLSNAEAANGDEYHIGITLEQGTYTLYVDGATVSNGGIVDYYLDNVSQSTGQDWYTVGTTYARKSVSITVPTSGYHILTMKINGQNGSSGGYRLLWSQIWATPTAY